MAVITPNNVIPGAMGHYYNAGAPSGSTFAGVAPKGALLVDTTNGYLYQNMGTQASPTWTKVGTQT